LISSCLKLNYNYYNKGYYDINRPKYKHPFYVKSIESKNNLIFTIPFIINKLFDNKRIAASLKFILFDILKSNDLKLVSD